MLKNKLVPNSLLPVVLLEEAAVGVPVEAPAVVAEEVVVEHHHSPIHVPIEPQVVVKVSDDRYSHNAPIAMLLVVYKCTYCMLDISIYLSLLSLFSCTILQIKIMKC
jgi:hypothetical protein